MASDRCSPRACPRCFLGRQVQNESVGTGDCPAVRGCHCVAVFAPQSSGTDGMERSQLFSVDGRRWLYDQRDGIRGVVAGDLRIGTAAARSSRDLP